MATFEERLAAVELLLGVTAGEKVYNSVYSGEQIDEAVGRALPGGALDTGKAPAGYGLGTKQDGVKDSFYRSGGAIGWYRVATARSMTASAIVSINHGWSSVGSSDLVLLVSAMGCVKCLTGDGAKSSNQSIISNARFVERSNGTYSLDVYCRAAAYNTWSINIINTGTNNSNRAEPSFTIQTPTFVAADDTLPEGETLLFPMEWLNPPMQLGVEYRTTERYMGKPVYTACVSFGDAVVGTDGYKSIEFYTTNVDKVIRATGESNGQTAPSIMGSQTSTNYGPFITAKPESGLIKILVSSTGHAEVTFPNVYVTVWYTKSTD